MLRRMLPFCAALVLLAPGLASAAGINLSWDDCGSAGTSNKTFACGTNSGSATMYVSVVAPTGITQLVGMTAALDLWTAADSVGTPIPSWWQASDGSCRAGKISPSFDFTSGPSSCVDPWGGAATGGIDYAESVPGANHATIRIAGATAEANAVGLTQGTEYYLAKVTVLYHKSTGTGSCSGCSSAASIALSSVKLAQIGLPETTLLGVIPSNVITWQGGVGTSPGPIVKHAARFGQVRTHYH